MIHYLDKIVEKGAEYFSRKAEMMTGTPSPELASALQEFERGLHYPLFGVTFLRDFAKQGQTVPEEELKKYGLTLDTNNNGNPYGKNYGKKFRDEYFDAQFNFCLTYDGQLIASIGFDLYERGIFIQDIHGIKGQRDKIKSLKWTRALVSQTAVPWAQQYGIPEMHLISVDNNRWAQDTFKVLKKWRIYPSGMTFEDAKRLEDEIEMSYRKAAEREGIKDVHLWPHQGFMLYDVTARRCGFKRASDRNYVKQLNSTVLGKGDLKS